MKLKKGFTLIEMLVVISLIGILAAMALVSFTSSQKQARDATRKSDLRQYQNALESFANLSNEGLYPEYRNAVTASTTLCDKMNEKFQPDIACAADPKEATNQPYRYISDGSGTTGTATATQYTVWAKLEGPATSTYWVVCSNGKIGEGTTQPIAGAICPI